MGNSSSKGKKGKGGKKGGKGSGGDDGCIGNRRVRTIILSILMIVFFAMGMPMFNDNRETAADAADLGGSESLANSMAAIFAGAAICIVGAICAVLLFIIPNCEDKLGRVAGFILVVGAIIYLIGWIVFVVDLNDSIAADAVRLVGGETEQRWNAYLSQLIGEALLPAGAALLLGLDAAFQIYENEAYRLSSNLGIIMIVSAMCIGAFYAQVCGEDDLLCATPDGVEAIATGYLILFWVCLIYIILYILTCCTCDCKDKCLVRLIIAVTLVIGGILTAIGYYVYVGGDNANYGGDDQNNLIVYYVGYSILIAGLAIVWALDMVFDDVKNR